MKTYPFTIPDNLQRYSYAIRDSTDFDHIQFGYFFTVNGIDVVDKLTIDKAIQQKILPFKQLHPYLKNPWIEDINDRCQIMLVCQDCFWRCTVQGGCEYICNNKYFVKEKTGTD
ncbi:hypothetical protein CL6EHI_074500 [Entamoeba histolytica]|uniref:Uncharacterized protein n=2 Tax=Entamoeba histolytica TaxID=5759 RepID=C4M9A0_ENTH1|nr:hypothetical protein EHI_074500 [Entamoeba histolytica HM-1:IMSS]EAL45574.1 hypothetical protein EHI_074500 [Entamoeba histolytica HM-1:IMSS]GAT98232.1 hypothetical protein CL6EHI_074500 [Entamoeba histolytica]|eukprot:XP_650960.1 hypothetical protein EHI_074500 [Entamoeba histolytica HM-1:IMSS]